MAGRGVVPSPSQWGVVLDKLKIVGPDFSCLSWLVWRCVCFMHDGFNGVFCNICSVEYLGESIESNSLSNSDGQGVLEAEFVVVNDVLAVVLKQCCEARYACFHEGIYDVIDKSCQVWLLGLPESFRDVFIHTCVKWASLVGQSKLAAVGAQELSCTKGVGELFMECFRALVLGAMVSLCKRFQVLGLLVEHTFGELTMACWVIKAECKGYGISAVVFHCY